MNTNILFRIHMPMEFLYALYAIGNKQSFYNMIKQFDLEPNEIIDDFINRMESKLSRYMSNELDYFYNLEGVGYILYKTILCNPELNHIDELLEQFEKLTPKTLIEYLIQSVCKNELDSEMDLRGVLDDHDKLLNLIEQTAFQSEHRKLKVLDFIENPYEMKQRFYLFLRHFYNYCFKPFEAEIKTILTPYINQYEKYYMKQPNTFLKQHLALDEPINDTIVIHISLFKYIHSDHYSFKDNFWFILGIYSDLLLSTEVSTLKYATLFKALSDENRIQILKLLSNKPYFGQEIAEQLDITPATVSYHMSFLKQNKIVSYKRINNRSYYEFDKTILQNSMNQFLSLLVKED